MKANDGRVSLSKRIAYDPCIYPGRQVHVRSMTAQKKFFDPNDITNLNTPRLHANHERSGVRTITNKHKDLKGVTQGRQATRPGRNDRDKKTGVTKGLPRDTGAN